jgi:hypothetical protein
VSMNEHALAGGEEVEHFVNPEQIRLSGEPPVVSAEVLLEVDGKLVYGSYRTTSLPGACRQALREYPGAEVLQVRRLVEVGEDGWVNSEV